MTKALIYKELRESYLIALGALALYLSIVGQAIGLQVLPLGGVERVISMQGTDLNVGLLYILAMSSLAVYAIVLAGWSSGSKYPLLGGVRATA